MGLACTLVVTPGCKGSPKLPPEPKVLGPALSLDEICEAIRDSNRKLASLEAKITLEILGPKTKGRCSGFLAVEKPRTMRIHASKALVPTLFNAYCDRHHFHVIFPKEKLIYRGRTDRPRRTTGDLHIFPDDISRILDQSDLFFKKVPVLEVWPDLYAITLVDVAGGVRPDPRISARLFVNRASLQVARLQLFDEAAEIRVEAVLGQFTNILGVVVPRAVELRWPKANTTLAVYLDEKSIKVNHSIDSTWLLYSGPKKEMQLIDLDHPEMGPRTVKPADKTRRRFGM